MSVRSSSPAPKSRSTAVATSPTTSRASDSPAAPRRRPAVGGDHLRRRELGRLPRRSEAEQQPDEKRGRGTERDHAHVEGERHRRGQQPLRNHRGRDAQNRRADAHSQDAPDRREHQAFGQELADDARPAGAQRRPDRQLTRAHRGARQQQVGDVGAADEQHEADDAEEQHRRQAELAADQGVVQRLERDAAPLVRLRELSRQPFGDGRHVGIRGLERHAGLQASDRPARTYAVRASGGAPWMGTSAQMLVRPSS